MSVNVNWRLREALETVGVTSAVHAHQHLTERNVPLSYERVRQLWNGSYDTTTETLLLISAALGVPVSVFFDSEAPAGPVRPRRRARGRRPKRQPTRSRPCSVSVRPPAAPSEAELRGRYS
jgi:transcriptional regulator with XRE-family HTH domain